MTKPKLQRDPETGKLLPKSQLALRHGLWLYKRTGKLPRIRGVRALKNELVELKQELEQITPDMNVKKTLVIDQIVRADGFMKLFELHVKKVGLPRADQWKKRIFDFQPAFTLYLSLARLQLQALQILGLDKDQAAKVLDLAEYVQARDKERDEKSLDVVGVGPGAVGIGPRRASYVCRDAKFQGKGEASELEKDDLDGGEKN